MGGRRGEVVPNAWPTWGVLRGEGRREEEEGVSGDQGTQLHGTRCSHRHKRSSQVTSRSGGNGNKTERRPIRSGNSSFPPPPTKPSKRQSTCLPLPKRRRSPRRFLKGTRTEDADLLSEPARLLHDVVLHQFEAHRYEGHPEEEIQSAHDQLLLTALFQTLTRHLITKTCNFHFLQKPSNAVGGSSSQLS